MMSQQHLLVLIRHGHSEWNLSNRFTGWTDIPLTEQGLSEAHQAGQLLASMGLQFDEVHHSALQRTRQTAETLLAAMRHPAIPHIASWRLNERHYGALQGMNKEEIFTTWGADRAHQWWRGYNEAPPALAEQDSRHPRHDPLYADLDPRLLPATESLADCQQRLLPYWQDTLAPRILAGKRLLVASHGNTLRSLIMHLENLSPSAVEALEIPAGTPLLYHFSPQLVLQNRHWLRKL